MRVPAGGSVPAGPDAQLEGGAVGTDDPYLADSATPAWLTGLDALLARLEAGEEVELAPALAAAATHADRAEPDQLARAIVTAARCLDLRARSLLPSPPGETVEAGGAAEEDTEIAAPALAERLAAYRSYQAAARVLRTYEQQQARRFARADASEIPAAAEPFEEIDLLLAAFRSVWERARPATQTIEREALSVERRMEELRHWLRSAAGPVEFAALFAATASRLAVVVTFLALLELVRLGEVGVVAADPTLPPRIAWLHR